MDQYEPLSNGIWDVASYSHGWPLRHMTQNLMETPSCLSTGFIDIC